MLRLLPGQRQHSKIVTLVCGIASAALLSFSCPARAQQDQPISSSDIGIEQVTYSDTSGTDVTGTGVLVIDEAALAAAGTTSGFINVTSADGWAVQNVPIVPGEGAIGVKFDMGTPDGTTDASDNLTVDISSTFDTSAPALGASTFTVNGDVEDSDGTGGTATDSNGDVENQGTAGKPKKPVITALPFNPAGTSKSASLEIYKQVQASLNQCGPAAAANNLSYLGSIGSISVVDSNTPGRGTGTSVLIARPGQNPNESAPVGTETTLVGQLDNTTGRYTGTSRTDANAAGTTPAQIVTGDEKYLGRTGFNSGTLIQENGFAPVPSFNGVSNTQIGGSLSDFLYNELNKGAAVMMQFDWANQFTGTLPATDVNGRWITGSHWVDVIGAGQYQGVPYAIYDSDLAQTPYDLGDSKYNTSTLNLPLIGNVSAYDIPEFSWIYSNNFTSGWYNTGQSLSYEGQYNYIGDAIAVVPEPASISLAGLAATLLIRKRRRTA
jgi:hypothetical protein